MRFLRVGLSLQMESHQEMLAAQQNLRKISELAEHEGDYAVFVTTAVYEAIVHLRSGAVDSVEQAQRAIASARSRQLQPSVKGLVQVWALLDVVNLACSLLQYNPEQVEEKMGVMQNMMDDGLKAWNEDGMFSVLVESSVQDHSAKSESGVLSKNKDGRDLLSFQWLQKTDLYTLGYFFSGVATLLKHSVTNDKAEKYLKEGLKLAQSTMADPDVSSGSLQLAKERTKWRVLVQNYLQLHLTIVLCARSDWMAARSSLSALEELSGSALMPTSVELTFARWTAYVQATIAQGTGDTDTALKLYQSSFFALPRPSPHRLANVATDLSILAAMNTISILRMQPVIFSQPEAHTVPALLEQLEPLCCTHSNASLRAALSLLKAICPTSTTTGPTILKTKQHINICLQTAQSAHNSQILAIAMAFTAARFFKDIVGAQAEKSSTTARALAKRAGSKLWLSVADGMLAGTLVGSGKGAEAEGARRECGEAMKGVPRVLREICGFE